MHCCSCTFNCILLGGTSQTTAVTQQRRAEEDQRRPKTLCCKCRFERFKGPFVLVRESQHVRQGFLPLRSDVC